MIGWLATAVFASSYLFRRPPMLRMIQAEAAFLWVIYGVAIDAVPVVVANLIVAGAALYSSFAQRRTEGGSEGPTQWATLGVGSATGSERGERNVKAMATAPRPIPLEAMNSQK